MIAAAIIILIVLTAFAAFSYWLHGEDFEAYDKSFVRLFLPAAYELSLRLKAFGIKTENVLVSKRQEERLRQVLDVDEDAKERVHLIALKSIAYIFLAVLMCLVLCVLIGLAGNSKAYVTYLKRPKPGEGDIYYDLRTEEYPNDSIRLKVSERVMGEAEVAALFEDVCISLPELILGNNESLDCISSDLELIDSVEQGSIKFLWSSSRPEVVSSDGTVYLQKADTDGTNVTLKAQLSYRDYLCEYETEVVVVPANYLTGTDNKLQSYLEDVEKAGKENEYVLLPNEYEGKKLTYISKTDISTYYLLPFLALVFGIMMAALEKERIDEKWKDRNRQMVIDYSEIVSKLSILIGAGFSVRGAWEQTVTDYEMLKENKKGGKRYAYEEMLIAYRSMNGGVSEVKAYEEFGRRCGIHSYVKLGNLLSQNVRQGSRGLAKLLKRETLEAFEEKKNISIRHGEEAGTKLLVPMVMLFIIVLAVLIVPAFMSI